MWNLSLKAGSQKDRIHARMLVAGGIPSCCVERVEKRWSRAHLPPNPLGTSGPTGRHNGFNVDAKCVCRLSFSAARTWSSSLVTTAGDATDQGGVFY